MRLRNKKTECTTLDGSTMPILSICVCRLHPPNDRHFCEKWWAQHIDDVLFCQPITTTIKRQSTKRGSKRNGGDGGGNGNSGGNNLRWQRATSGAVAATQLSRRFWRPWRWWLQVLRHCKSHRGKESEPPNQKRIPLHVHEIFFIQIIHDGRSKSGLNVT